jgi:hypothetical protein
MHRLDYVERGNATSIGVVMPGMFVCDTEVFSLGIETSLSVLSVVAA